MPPPFTRKTDSVDRYMANDINELQVTAEDHEARIDVLEISGGSGAADHIEDVAHVSGDTGTFILGVRNDADAVLTGANLDYSPVAVDSAGRLKFGAGTMTLSGEDHIGETGFSTAIVTPVFTMDTTPDYTAGDVYGDKTTLTNAMRVSSGGGLLTAITVADVDNISPVFDVLLFDADPTGTTWTDNAAPTMAAATAAQLLAMIPFPASFVGGAYVAVGGVAVGTARNLDLVVKANGTANLFVVLIARATINVVTATHLKLRFHFVRY
jgi:hypothetical protein